LLRENPELSLVLQKTVEYAKSLNHQYLTLEHLLYSLTCYKNFKDILSKYGVDTNQMHSEINKYVSDQKLITQNTQTQTNPVKTATLSRVIERSANLVVFQGRDHIRLIDIYVSITQETTSYAAYILKKHLGSTNEDSEKFIKFYEDNYQEHKVTAEKGKMDTNQALELLEKHCINLNALANDGKIDPVIGREEELTDITQILAKKNKSNVLLIGDSGIGKTCLIEGLALNIAKGFVPNYLKDWTVWNLDIGTLLAGTKYRGEFEEKIVEIIDALSVTGKCILFIDEAHQMSGAGSGSSGGPDLANMLKPAISKGRIKVIASTTWEEYKKSFEKDKALMRRFRKLMLTEPTPNKAKQILRGIKSYFETFHGGFITDEAIDEAVDLSIRYQKELKLPDKAIDLIDSACAKFKILDATDWIVNKSDIQLEISKATKIPLEQLDEVQTEKIKDLSFEVKKVVYGQDEAVDIITDELLISKAGLKDPNKPIGSFLLLGPTGVGKTLICKELSKQLNMHLIRVDCSEYQEKHSVSKLIGAPPGYVGFDDSTMGGGQLVNEIEIHPNSIILFDEIEKAHPDVTLILLQMMDEGYINGVGKQANCRESIIVLTSNLGSVEMEQNLIGFDQSSKKNNKSAIKDFFKPEFRNRLSAICTFNKLDNLSYRKIVVSLINDINNLLSAKKFQVVASEKLIDYIIETGVDDKMGARPLARKVSKLIKLPLSKKILFDNVADESKLLLDWDGELKITVQSNISKIQVEELVTEY